MKANISLVKNITPGVEPKWQYLIEWLNDDATSPETKRRDTLSEALAWCRTQEIGWVIFVGFSDELIELEEFRCLNKGAAK